jgi:hypothetical protein
LAKLFAAAFLLSAERVAAESSFLVKPEAARVRLIVSSGMLSSSIVSTKAPRLAF